MTDAGSGVGRPRGLGRPAQKSFNPARVFADDGFVRAEIDDLPLLRGVREGDPFSWADLYDECQPRISAYLTLIGDAELADDEIRLWSTAAEGVADLPGGTDPKIFLFTVAHRLHREGDQPEVIDDEVFAALSAFEREVVALRVVGGLDDAETATVLGRRVQTVEAAGHRALASMLRALPA